MLIKFDSQFNLTKVYKLLLISILMFTISYCGYITPSNENRILFNRPNKLIEEISLTFKLENDLTFNQYIAVRFPNTMSEFIQATKPDTISCSLKLIDQLDTIENSRLSFQASEGENNIVYCKTKVDVFKDTFYKLVLTFYSSNNIYTLTDTKNIQLDNSEYFNGYNYIERTPLKRNYYNQIGLFTSNDYKEGKLIIDSNSLFSEAAVFDSVFSTLAGNNQIIPLSITSSKLSTEKLMYNTVFDVILSIKINSYIDKSSIIMIHWPSNYLNPPYNCVSEKLEDSDSTDITKAELAGNINCIFFGSKIDTFVVNGLKENLYKDREFQLIIKGFQTKELPTLVAQKISISVFNKNSYSVISEASAEVFNISKASFSKFDVTQADSYPDIYKNSIYNFTFNFSVDVDLPSGVYIIIEHSNYSAKTNKINFIASTCDFSVKDSPVSQAFGERPICVPLKDNFDYISNIGSSIFFKISKLKKNTDYYFNVFMLTEECGNISWAQRNFNENGQTNYAKFNFQIRLLNSIDTSKQGSERFSQATEVAATKSTSVDSVTCWHDEMFSIEEGNNFYSEVPYIRNSEKGFDSIIYNEITSFELSSISNISECYKNSDCYFNNIKTNVDKYHKSYLYTTNFDNSAKDSYINIRSDIYIKGLTSVKPLHLIATPIAITGDGVVNISGKLSLKMNSKFLEIGDSNNNCWVSWAGQYLGNNNLNRIYNNLSCGKYTDPAIPCPFSDTNKQLSLLETGSANASKNFITLIGEPTIDSSTLRQTASTEPHIVVQSNVDSSDKFKFNRDYDLTCTNDDNCGFYSFNLFSNCVKFAKNIYSIQTQYAYLEAYLSYSSSDADNNFIRVNRYFKFATELRAINDFNKSYSSFDREFATFHYVNFINSNYNSVCLLQLSKNIRNAGNLDSDLIAVYLYNVRLFDVDYSNLSSDYPATPLRGNSKAYAMLSAPVHSNTSFLIKNKKIFQDDLSFNSRTTPYIFLTNYVLFTNFGIYQFTDDIYIPSYCPYQKVSVSVSWMKGSDYRFQSVDSLIGMPSTYGGISYQIVPPFTKGLSIPKTSNNVRLAFNLYSNENDYTMYIYNTEKEDAGGFTECTGFSIFMSDSINLTYNIDYSINFYADGQNSYYVTKGYQFSSKTNFYVFGVPFNKAILAGSSQYTYKINYTNENSITSTSNETASFIVGITRPSLDSLKTVKSAQMNKDILQTNNSVAFFCTGFNQGNLTYLTSFNSLKAINAFVLDFLLDDKTEWPKAEISLPTKSIFPNKNYFLISFETAIILTQQVYVGFKFEGAGQDTICYLIGKEKSTSNKIDLASVLDDSSFNKCSESENKNILFECKVPLKGQSFNIACFNIEFPNSESFKIEKLIVYLNNATSEVILQTTPIINTSLTYSLTDPLNEIQTVLSASIVPALKKVEYKLVSQFGTFVKIQLTVDLGRPIIRNSKVLITADFEDFLIPSINPFCSIHIPSNNNTTQDSSKQSQVLISSCKLYGEISKFDTIEIEFKDIIVNEFIDFSKEIVIEIWPVKAIMLPFMQSSNLTLLNNSSTDQINTVLANARKISVDISVFMQKTNELIYSNKQSDDTSDSTLTSSTNSSLDQNKVMQLYLDYNSDTTFFVDSPLYQETSFCDIVDINPEIPGEYTDITFSFDFFNKFYLNTPEPEFSNQYNEIIIYFPVSFILEDNNVRCSIDLLDTEQVRCDLIERDVLLVKYSASMNSFIGFIKLKVSGVKIEEINNKTFTQDSSSLSIFPDFISSPKSKNYNNSSFNSSASTDKDRAIDSPTFACMFKVFSGEIVYSGLGSANQNLSFISKNSNQKESLSIVKVTTNTNKTRRNFNLNILAKLDTDNMLTAVPKLFQASNMFFLLTFSGYNQDNKHSNSFYLENYDVPTNPDFLVYNEAISNQSSYFNFSAYNYIPDCLLYVYAGDGAVRTNNLNSSVNTKTSISLSSCRLIGNNSVLFEIEPEVIEFSKTFKFFELQLNGIVTPQEETPSIGEFSLAFSSKDKQFYYKTYSNLSQLAFNNLSFPYDNFVKAHKGLAFEQNLTKWIIDVQENLANSSKANYIIIKPGRYKTIRVVVRNPVRSQKITSTSELSLNPSNTELYMTDYVFNLYEKNPLIFSNIGLLRVNIGTTCTTIPGTYYTALYTKNTLEYAESVAIKVLVDSTKGNIRVEYAFPSSFKETNLFKVQLSESAFAPVEVKFEKVLAKIKITNKVLKDNSINSNNISSKSNLNDYTTFFVAFKDNLNTSEYQVSQATSLKSIISNNTSGVDVVFLRKILSIINESIIDNTVVETFQSTANTFFSISSDVPEDTQVELIFKPVSLSSCYKFDFNELQVSVLLKPKDQQEIIDFSAGISILNQGGFFPTGSNTQMQNRANLNSLSFKLDLPLQSGYLTCALQCLSQTTISDNDLLLNSQKDSISTNTSENYRKEVKNFPGITTNQYSSFQTYLSNASSITFSYNVIRGEYYKLKCLILNENKSKVEARGLIENITLSENINKLSAVSTETTQCLQFTFQYDPPYQYKQKIVDYCQTLFNEKTGCLICVDNYGRTSDGYNFSNNYSCAAKSVYGIQKFKETDIEFVEDGKKTSTSGELVDENLMVRNNNPTFNPNEKGVSELEIRYNNTFYKSELYNNYNYLVCVVADKQCKTNPENFYDKMMKFINSINSNLLIESKLGLREINLLDTEHIQETASPNISTIGRYIGYFPTISISGFYDIQIYFSTALNCYWKFQYELDLNQSATEDNYNPIGKEDFLLKSPITSYDIINCTSNARCGNIKINREMRKMVPKSTVPFKNGVYSYYLSCFNDLPYAQKFSEPLKLFAVRVQEVSQSGNDNQTRRLLENVEQTNSITNDSLYSNTKKEVKDDENYVHDDDNNDLINEGSFNYANVISKLKYLENSDGLIILESSEKGTVEFIKNDLIK